MYIYIGIAGIIAFFVLLVYFLQDKYRTPKQSGNLTKSHRKRIPLILLAGLDHFADLVPLKEFIPQVLESDAFGKKKMKRTRRFTLPQKVNVDEVDIQVAEDKSERLTKQYIQGLNDLNNLQITLRGVNTPIFVGTKNRTIAASLPFLSALNWTKDIEQLSKDAGLIEAFKTAKDARVRNVGEILSRMAIGVSGVDFHAVYKNIDINYDPTISDSISERDKADGRMERSEDKDKQTKTVLYLILGIAALFVIGVVAAKLL
jgi:uncharacterized membrane protein YuzA (DUF378 family)